MSQAFANVSIYSLESVPSPWKLWRPRHEEVLWRNHEDESKQQAMSTLPLKDIFCNPLLVAEYTEFTLAALEIRTIVYSCWPYPTKEKDGGILDKQLRHPKCLKPLQSHMWICLVLRTLSGTSSSGRGYWTGGPASIVEEPPRKA